MIASQVGHKPVLTPVDMNVFYRSAYLALRNNNDIYLLGNSHNLPSMQEGKTDRFSIDVAVNEYSEAKEWAHGRISPILTTYNNSAEILNGIEERLDLKWELAPIVSVFADRTKVSHYLYPVFGEVEEVDLTRNRLLVNLLESPFDQGIIVQFRLPNNGSDDQSPNSYIPAWLGVKGAIFEATATLSITEPGEFFIGEFHPLNVEVTEDIDYTETFRKKAEATYEFRF